MIRVKVGKFTCEKNMSRQAFTCLAEINFLWQGTLNSSFQIFITAFYFKHLILFAISVPVISIWEREHLQLNISDERCVVSTFGLTSKQSTFLTSGHLEVQTRPEGLQRWSSHTTNQCSNFMPQLAQGSRAVLRTTPAFMIFLRPEVSEVRTELPVCLQFSTEGNTCS